MAKIQLRLDFAPTTQSIHKVNCQKCKLAIDLVAQSAREIKACPHCGDRTWLLNLKSKEACILYGIKPETLGGRLRDGD